MKVRHGFVSNSSSSNFIIRLTFLNDDQIWALRNLEAYMRDVLGVDEDFYGNGCHYEMDTKDEDSEIPDDCMWLYTSSQWYSLRFILKTLNISDDDICSDYGSGIIDIAYFRDDVMRGDWNPDGGDSFRMIRNDYGSLENFLFNFLDKHVDNDGCWHKEEVPELQRDKNGINIEHIICELDGGL